MKRKVVSIGLLILLTLTMVLTACQSTPAPTSTTAAPPATTSTSAPATSKPATSAPATSAPATTSAAAYKWPAQLALAVPEVGSATYGVVAGFSAPLEKATGMKLGAASMSTDSDRITAFNNKQVTAMCEAFTELAYWMRGTDFYAALPKTAFGVVWNFQDSEFLYWTYKDSPLKTIYDIKAMAAAGKPVRVARIPSVISLDAFCYLQLPAFLGMKQSDFIWVPASSPNALYRLLSDGKADVVIAGTSSAVVREVASAPQGMRALDMPVSDKEGWKRVLAADASPLCVPVKADYGIAEAIGHEGWVNPQQMTARADMDQELVYNLAKWFDQNYASYKDATEGNSRMSLAIFRRFLNGSPIPVAPGTVKYLKEINQWTAADDAWNNDATKLMNRYVDAWNTTTAAAKAANVAVDATNQKWLDMWAAAVKDIPPFTTRLQ